MRRLAFLATFLLLPVTVATPSLAATTAEDGPSALQSLPARGARGVAGGRETETYWYGWQTLLVDAASTGVLVAISPSKGAIIPMGTYVFGGPVVHLLHVEPLRAGGSFLVRVAAPIGFAAVASALVPNCRRERDTDCEGWRIPIEIGIAAALGAAAASAVDASLLAYTTRPVGPAKSAVSAALQPTRGGVTVGVSGVF